jgi:hypothetical protein
MRVRERQNEVAELRLPLLIGKRRVIQNVIAFVDVLLDEGFG